MVRQAPVAIAMFDRALRYIAASERWVTERGGGRTDLVGLDVLDGASDPPEWWRYVQQHALAGETLRKDEDAWVLADGGRRWLRWAMTPWLDETGAISGVIVMIEDITDRKRAVEQLRESELRYTTIFESSPFAIVLSRWSDDTIVSANSAFLDLFECAREDVIGKVVTSTGFADHESHTETLNLLEQLGTVRDFEVTRVTKSGKRRQLSLNLDWVMLGGEKHVLVHMRDITELHEAQAKARLYDQTKHLDELKTRFFASVSHDLRTPLTLILAPTERMLGSGELSDAQRHDLAVIARNARTLLHHVTDLLDVARLEAGRMTVAYADTDVCSLVRFVAGHFEALAAERQVSFTIDVPDRLRAQLDPDKLQRILLNVLSNAFKLTPAGGRVRVTACIEDSHLRIEVADSGPGVPPELRQAIFEPFQELGSRTRGPLGRGAGLGLAIARELAQLHAGTITVGDAPEGGAQFVVVLPERAPPGTEVAPPVPERGDEARTVVAELRERTPMRAVPIGTRGPLVLVVEDNPEMSLFISENLAIDHRVVTACDGRDGLRKAIAMKPDLILTDMMLPGMGGDEMVRAIRSRRDFDRVPIVVLTAKADDELRVAMLRAGAQDYIHKPFVVEELRARVDNLIERKRAEERNVVLQRQLEDVAAASTEVSAAVASLPESSVRAVLHTIALRAQTLTAAQYAAVGIGGDPEAPFDPWVAVGMSPDVAAAIGRAPRPLGVLRAAAVGGLRVRDVRLHPAFRGFPPGHPPMTSFLGVPIVHQGRPVGTMFLANKRGADEFSAQDQRIAEMLGARVGVAIETARLYRNEGQQRAWLQAVVDQMPDPVVLADTECAITARNRAAVALGAMVLVRPTGRSLSPDEDPIVRAIQQGRTTIAEELVVRAADGRDIPALVSAAPVRMADGRLAGATMVLQDISTLKELQRLREEWESIVTHDLRQPINAIVLLADMLESAGLPVKNRELVGRVRALAMRMARMVGDLSDASQLEARRLVIRHERLDLGLLVREVIERLPALASRTTLHVPHDRVLLVSGDAGRLEQVLTNLLSNAEKYSAPGTPIVVDVAGVDDSAQVSVTNEGSRITESELPYLFERFARTRQARASATKGSGLGLYIARGLVEAHGGRIWIESAPGTTTFRFTLPLSPELADQPQPVSSA